VSSVIVILVSRNEMGIASHEHNGVAMSISARSAIAAACAVAAVFVLPGTSYAGVQQPPAGMPIPAGLYAFVVNSDTPYGNAGSIAVINTKTHQVQRKVSQGLGVNPNGIAVTADGSNAYVANFGHLGVGHDSPLQTVSVVDMAAGQVIKTLQVGKQPLQAVISPDGNRVYVVNSGTVIDNGSISVIDTATDTVIDTIANGVNNPAGIAISPDGRRAYITNETDSNVSVVDLRTNQVIDQIGLERRGQYPTGVAISPDGMKVYVANNSAGGVSVIDTVTGTLDKPITLPGFGSPYGIAVSPDGKKVYVTEAGVSDVAVIDTRTGTATLILQPKDKTYRVGRNPVAVAFTPDGTQAYVTSSLDDPRGVSIIDVATDQVIDSFNAGSGPFAVTFASTSTAFGTR
jgi:YVTN family beta-propeller protein